MANTSLVERKIGEEESSSNEEFPNLVSKVDMERLGYVGVVRQDGRNYMVKQTDKYIAVYLLNKEGLFERHGYAEFTTFPETSKQP
jgi:hypothetical protein